MTEIFEERKVRYADILEQLLAAPKFPFDDKLVASVPERHGLYVITTYDGSGQHKYLYAGTTGCRRNKRPAGLRARIDDHFSSSGSSSSDLPDLVAKRQLGISEGASKTRNGKQAVAWIRGNCQIQWLVVEDSGERCWAEHYVLSILRPIWCT